MRAAGGRGLWLWGLLVLAGTGGACSQKESFRTAHPQVLKINDLPEDFKIPANIWNLIENEGEKKAEAPSPLAAGTFYSTVKVYLTEKNEGILKNPSLVLELPRGGGEVDLAEYLSGQQGTFYLGFELPAEFQEGAHFKVLYLSEGRRRRIENRIYGAGCKQYIDITHKFLEMMKGEGLKANTTRQRHVTVLAGRYIFSVIKDNRIYITQVTITDSQNKNLLCEAL